MFRERVLGPRPPYSDRLSDLSLPPGPEDLADADLEQPERVFGLMIQAAIHSLLRIDQNAGPGRTGPFRDGAGGGRGGACRGGAGGLRAWGLHSSMGWRTSGVRAHLVDNLGAMRAEQVAAIGPRDVLLAMTFDDYTPETVERWRRWPQRRGAGAGDHRQ